jgi:hypothetical protein
MWAEGGERIPLLFDRLMMELATLRSGRRFGSEEVVAGDHGAFARSVHRQPVEQGNHGEEPVYLAALGTDDGEPAVMGLEPLKGVDENVYPGGADERDLA